MVAFFLSTRILSKKWSKMWIWKNENATQILIFRPPYTNKFVRAESKNSLLFMVYSYKRRRSMYYFKNDCDIKSDIDPTDGWESITIQNSKNLRSSIS